MGQDEFESFTSNN